MFYLLHTHKFCAPVKALVYILITSLTFGLVTIPTTVQAQSIISMPLPAGMVSTSVSYVPAVLKGITINPSQPFHFDFLVDKGDSSLSDQEFETESMRLIKYFLASLTVPENDLWVNLSPYENDRVIPDKFGLTEMGRDLLAQDYLLKQFTASLMYPEDELGKKFWDRVYKLAYQRFGTTNIPINTFNKVWIVPEKAVIHEHGYSAFVAQSRLKVMLEEDYLSLNESVKENIYGTEQHSKKKNESINNFASDVVREILIPEIEREVNEGKHFARLRQVYHSLILATWYRENIQRSLINQVYSGQNKIDGIDLADRETKDKIYQQYMQAFKKGVYNYIKEDYDKYKDQVIPRKYFSGGMQIKPSITVVRDANAVTPRGDMAMISTKFDLANGGRIVDSSLQSSGKTENTVQDIDLAMLSDLKVQVDFLVERIKISALGVRPYEYEINQIASQALEGLQILPGRLLEFEDRLNGTTLGAQIRARARRDGTGVFMHPVLMKLADLIDKKADELYANKKGREANIRRNLKALPESNNQVLLAALRTNLSRLMNGMPVVELARRSGLSRSVIDKILKGRAQSLYLETALKISNGLKITLYELLVGERINAGSATPYYIDEIRESMLGRNIESLRLQKVGNLPDFESKSGIKKKHLHLIESGGVLTEVVTFIQIARTLNVELDTLLKPIIELNHIPKIELYNHWIKLDPEFTIRTFGKQILDERNRHNIHSQLALVELMKKQGVEHIEQEEISRLERGDNKRIHLETALKYIQFFDSSIFEFTSGYEMTDERAASYAIDVVRKNLGPNLKMIIETKGLTLRELSARTGIHRQVISTYSNGKLPSLTGLIALSKALEIPPDILIDTNDRVREYIKEHLAPVARDKQFKAINGQWDSVAHRLKMRRVYTGYTKKEFAQEVGIRKEFVAAIEGGQLFKVPFTVILKMADYFHEDIFTLLSGRKTLDEEVKKDRQPYAYNGDYFQNLAFSLHLQQIIDKRVTHRNRFRSQLGHLEEQLPLINEGKVPDLVTFIELGAIIRGTDMEELTRFYWTGSSRQQHSADQAHLADLTDGYKVFESSDYDEILGVLQNWQDRGLDIMYMLTSKKGGKLSINTTGQDLKLFYIGDKESPQSILVVEESQTIRNYLYVPFMATDPAFEGRGYMKRLLKALVDRYGKEYEIQGVFMFDDIDYLTSLGFAEDVGEFLTRPPGPIEELGQQLSKTDKAMLTDQAFKDEVKDGLQRIADIYGGLTHGPLELDRLISAESELMDLKDRYESNVYLRMLIKDRRQPLQAAALALIWTPEKTSLILQEAQKQMLDSIAGLTTLNEGEPVPVMEALNDIDINRLQARYRNFQSTDEAMFAEQSFKDEVAEAMERLVDIYSSFAAGPINIERIEAAEAESYELEAQHATSPYIPHFIQDRRNALSIARMILDLPLAEPRIQNMFQKAIQQILDAQVGLQNLGENEAVPIIQSLKDIDTYTLIAKGQYVRAARLLKNRLLRPSPFEVRSLTRGAIEQAANVNQYTLHSITDYEKLHDIVLPILANKLEALVKKHEADKPTYVIISRDGDMIYDALMSMADSEEMRKRIKLINISLRQSERFLKPDSPFYEPEQREGMISFLAQEGLSREDLSSGGKFVFIDSAYKGSIFDTVLELNGLTREDIDKNMSGYLVFHDDGSSPYEEIPWSAPLDEEKVLQSLLKIFGDTIDHIMPLHIKEKWDSLDTKRKINWLAAVYLQIQPKFLRNANAVLNVDGTWHSLNRAYESYYQDLEPIDFIEFHNPHQMDPVGALKLQALTVKYFQEHQAGMHDQALIGMDDEEIKRFEKTMPLWKWRRALVVPEDELIRSEQEQKSVRIDPENFTNYVTNQRYLRGAILRLLHSLSIGEIGYTRFKEEFAHLHKIMITGIDGSTIYVPLVWDYDESGIEEAYRIAGSYYDYTEQEIGERLEPIQSNLLKLIEASTQVPAQSKDANIALIADFYQSSLGEDLGYQLFERGWNSLLMNFVNALLRLHGLNGVSHDRFDMIQYFQERDMKEYFIQRVKLANPQNFPREDYAMLSIDQFVDQRLSELSEIVESPTIHPPMKARVASGKWLKAIRDSWESEFGVPYTDEELTQAGDLFQAGWSKAGLARIRSWPAQVMLLTPNYVNEELYLNFYAKLEALIKNAPLEDKIKGYWARGISLVSHLRFYGNHYYANFNEPFVDQKLLMETVQQYIRLLIERDDITMPEEYLWGLVVMLDPLVFNPDFVMDNWEKKFQLHTGYGQMAQNVERIFEGISDLDRDRIERLLNRAFSITDEQWHNAGFRSPYTDFVISKFNFTLADMFGLIYRSNDEYPMLDDIFVVTRTEEFFQANYRVDADRKGAGKVRANLFSNERFWSPPETLLAGLRDLTKQFLLKKLDKDPRYFYKSIFLNPRFHRRTGLDDLQGLSTDAAMLGNSELRYDQKIVQMAPSSHPDFRGEETVRFWEIFDVKLSDDAEKLLRAKISQKGSRIISVSRDEILKRRFRRIIDGVGQRITLGSNVPALLEDINELPTPDRILLEQNYPEYFYGRWQDTDIQDKRKIRVSSSAYARLKVDERYVVGYFDAEPRRNGIYKYIPIGGGIQYTGETQQYLEYIGASFDQAGHDLDLRFLLPVHSLQDFEDFFDLRTGRELFPLRELKEELVDEIGFLTRREFSFIFEDSAMIAVQIDRDINAKERAYVQQLKETLFDPYFEQAKAFSYTEQALTEIPEFNFGLSVRDRFVQADGTLSAIYNFDIMSILKDDTVIQRNLTAIQNDFGRQPFSQSFYTTPNDSLHFTLSPVLRPQTVPYTPDEIETGRREAEVLLRDLRAFDVWIEGITVDRSNGRILAQAFVFPNPTEQLDEVTKLKQTRDNVTIGRTTITLATPYQPLTDEQRIQLFDWVEQYRQQEFGRFTVNTGYLIYGTDSFSVNHEIVEPHSLQGQKINPLELETDTDPVTYERILKYQGRQLRKIGEGIINEIYDLGDGRVIRLRRSIASPNQWLYLYEEMADEGFVPHILSSGFSADGLPFVVTEKIEGDSLDGWSEPLDEADIKKVTSMLKWLMDRQIYIADFFKLSNHMIGHKTRQKAINDYFVDIDLIRPWYEPRSLKDQYLEDFEDHRTELGFFRHWQKIDPDKKILAFIQNYDEPENMHIRSDESMLSEAQDETQGFTQNFRTTPRVRSFFSLIDEFDLPRGAKVQIIGAAENPQLGFAFALKGYDVRSVTLDLKGTTIEEVLHELLIDGVKQNGGHYRINAYTNYLFLPEETRAPELIILPNVLDDPKTVAQNNLLHKVFDEIQQGGYVMFDFILDRDSWHDRVEQFAQRNGYTIQRVDELSSPELGVVYKVLDKPALEDAALLGDSHDVIKNLEGPYLTYHKEDGALERNRTILADGYKGRLGLISYPDTETWAITLEDSTSITEVVYTDNVFTIFKGDDRASRGVKFEMASNMNQVLEDIIVDEQAGRVFVIFKDEFISSGDIWFREDLTQLKGYDRLVLTTSSAYSIYDLIFSSQQDPVRTAIDRLLDEVKTQSVDTDNVGVRKNIRELFIDQSDAIQRVTSKRIEVLGDINYGDSIGEASILYDEDQEQFILTLDDGEFLRALNWSGGALQLIKTHRLGATEVTPLAYATDLPFVDFLIAQPNKNLVMVLEDEVLDIEAREKLDMNDVLVVQDLFNLPDIYTMVAISRSDYEDFKEEYQQLSGKVFEKGDSAMLGVDRLKNIVLTKSALKKRLARQGIPPDDIESMISQADNPKSLRDYYEFEAGIRQLRVMVESLQGPTVLFIGGDGGLGKTSLSEKLKNGDGLGMQSNDIVVFNEDDATQGMPDHVPVAVAAFLKLIREQTSNKLIIYEGVYRDDVLERIKEEINSHHMIYVTMKGLFILDRDIHAQFEGFVPPELVEQMKGPDGIKQIGDMRRYIEIKPSAITRSDEAMLGRLKDVTANIIWGASSNRFDPGNARISLGKGILTSIAALGICTGCSLLGPEFGRTTPYPENSVMVSSMGGFEVVTYSEQRRYLYTFGLGSSLTALIVLPGEQTAAMSHLNVSRAEHVQTMLGASIKTLKNNGMDTTQAKAILIGGEVSVSEEMLANMKAYLRLEGIEIIDIGDEYLLGRDTRNIIYDLKTGTIHFPYNEKIFQMDLPHEDEQRNDEAMIGRLQEQIPATSQRVAKALVSDYFTNQAIIEGSHFYIEDELNIDRNIFQDLDGYYWVHVHKRRDGAFSQGAQSMVLNLRINPNATSGMFFDRFMVQPNVGFVAEGRIVSGQTKQQHQRLLRKVEEDLHPFLKQIAGVAVSQLETNLILAEYRDAEQNAILYEAVSRRHISEEDEVLRELKFDDQWFEDVPMYVTAPGKINYNNLNNFRTLETDVAMLANPVKEIVNILNSRRGQQKKLQIDATEVTRKLIDRGFLPSEQKVGAMADDLLRVTDIHIRERARIIKTINDSLRDPQNYLQVNFQGLQLRLMHPTKGFTDTNADNYHDYINEKVTRTIEWPIVIKFLRDEWALDDLTLSAVRKKLGVLGIIYENERGQAPDQAMTMDLGDVGMILGEYTIEKIITEGSSPTFKARDANDREVSIKFRRHHKDPEQEDRYRYMFNTQIRALRKIRDYTETTDPSIYAHFPKYVKHTDEYVVLEWIKGRNLKELIDEQETNPYLTLGDRIFLALDVGIKVLRLVDFLHTEFDFIIRDIKPENILYDIENGELIVKIIDLEGVLINGESEDGPLVVSPAYGPPELFDPSRKIGFYSDISALGASLYQLLTGELPFSSDSLSDLLHAKLQQEPKYISDGESLLPREIKDILKIMLSADPQDRFQTAEEALEALEKYRVSLIKDDERVMKFALRRIYGSMQSNGITTDKAERLPTDHAMLANPVEGLVSIVKGRRRPHKTLHINATVATRMLLEQRVVPTEEDIERIVDKLIKYARLHRAQKRYLVEFISTALNDPKNHLYVNFKGKQLSLERYGYVDANQYNDFVNKKIQRLIDWSAVTALFTRSWDLDEMTRFAMDKRIEVLEIAPLTNRTDPTDEAMMGTLKYHGQNRLMGPINRYGRTLQAMRFHEIFEVRLDQEAQSLLKDRIRASENYILVSEEEIKQRRIKREIGGKVEDITISDSVPAVVSKFAELDANSREELYRHYGETYFDQWPNSAVPSNSVFVSGAALVRVKIGDKFLLIRHDKRRPDGTLSYKLIGGALEFDRTLGQFFDSLGAKNIKGKDIRMELPTENLAQFIDWFNKEEGRETNPSRELFEELVEESSLLSTDEFHQIFGAHFGAPDPVSSDPNLSSDGANTDQMMKATERAKGKLGKALDVLLEVASAIGRSKEDNIIAVMRKYREQAVYYKEVGNNGIYFLEETVDRSENFGGQFAKGAKVLKFHIDGADKTSLKSLLKEVFAPEVKDQLSSLGYAGIYFNTTNEGLRKLWLRETHSIEIKAPLPTAFKTRLTSLYGGIFYGYSIKGSVRRVVLPFSQQASDEMMKADEPKKGGIDFTPKNLNLEIHRDEQGLPIPLSNEQLQNINIDGLVPVIINIQPVTNLPLLLGASESQETDPYVADTYKREQFGLKERERVLSKI